MTAGATRASPGTRCVCRQRAGHPTHRPAPGRSGLRVAPTRLVCSFVTPRGEESEGAGRPAAHAPRSLQSGRPEPPVTHADLADRGSERETYACHAADRHGAETVLGERGSRPASQIKAAEFRDLIFGATFRRHIRGELNLSSFPVSFLGPAPSQGPVHKGATTHMSTSPCP